MLEFLLEWGYVGVFLGCFLAATVVPFASDALLVAMLLAGGNVWMTVACASAGNWLGGLTTYGIGRIGKWEWIEKWFRVKRETIEKQKTKVDRWGPLLALATWVPFVGDVFALVLGFYKAPFVQSAVYMLIGKTGRFVVWALLFLAFGQNLPWLA